MPGEPVAGAGVVGVPDPSAGGEVGAIPVPPEDDVPGGYAPGAVVPLLWATAWTGTATSASPASTRLMRANMPIVHLEPEQQGLPVSRKGRPE